MKTEFYDLVQKSDIMKKLEVADRDAIVIVISEIERLESIIRDYEIALSISMDKLSGSTFKYPKYNIDVLHNR